MNVPRTTIRHKLVVAMMLTSTTVLLLTGAALVLYDMASNRRDLVRTLETRAEIVAANATASLAFQNPEDAAQVLVALKRDPSTVAAALYDRQGRLFATYPAGISLPAGPSARAAPTHRMERSAIVVTQPVVEERRWLGTLYLKSSMRPLDARLRVHTLAVLLAVAGSIAVAFGLSTWLQRGIAEPVRALAETARAISDRKDFSIRAVVRSDDELGVLTDTFNIMLGQLQERDVALRANEARLRAILESALDGIITMDHEGRIVEFNPAAERLFGHERAAAIGVELASLIIPAAQRERHRQGLARYLSSDVPTLLDRRLELTAVGKDGREFPVEVAITRIPQQGEPVFTGFIRDITERKRAEQEIRQLNADLERRVIARTAELEASNRELEAFSYSVSHDLRAPLRHIDGFADLLGRRAGEHLDDKSRHYLTTISVAAKSMGALIDDLLAFSRMGRAELLSAPVDLEQLIDEVRAGLATDIAGRTIAWSIDSLPVVSGDPAMLRVVLTNLLANAVKYSRTRDEARIDIRASQSETETVIEVQDNGVGFDPAYGDKLFGVFQRLHGADEFEGTGIGLANVRRIIERHGGRTWATGAVNQGATFFMSLPRTADQSIIAKAA
jgi:PAS domain S-box-containing protein